MAHFGLGNFGIHLSPYTALLVGIAFNNAGYLAENFRGALKAMPDTQTRSGRSLGMTSMQTFRLIIMPQMLRVADSIIKLSEALLREYPQPFC